MLDALELKLSTRTPYTRTFDWQLTDWWAPAFSGAHPTCLMFHVGFSFGLG